MSHPVLRKLVEAALVLAAGTAAGLSVNAARSKGLALGKDFYATRSPAGTGAAPSQIPFDRAASPSPAGPAASAPAPASPSPTPEMDPAEAESVAQLTAQGYQVIGHADVVKLHDSPEFAQEQVVFVDARADSPYQEGHIAGAYQLDHFHLEAYMPGVKAACDAADKIVVYCNGGECEDSKLVSSDLMDAGILPSRVYVYVGGIMAWKKHRLPLERGARNSRDFYESVPEVP